MTATYPSTRPAGDTTTAGGVMVSVVLPTYNEAENVRTIIPLICSRLVSAGISCEVIVVDDDSPDGTAQQASRLAQELPVVVHRRTAARGLASAVAEGFDLARGGVCAVMDADFSHPVETLPGLVLPILAGECDATVGSRYIAGGGRVGWSPARRIASRAAGLLSRGLTSLSDPTSGFMAIRKELLEGVPLEPIGWKIVLEIIVKTNPRVLEVPFVFEDRRHGESKFGVRSQIDYLRHLATLYRSRHKLDHAFLAYCLIGISGLAVDTIVLVALVEAVGLDPVSASALAFFAAVIGNHFLERHWASETGEPVRPGGFARFLRDRLPGLAVILGTMAVLAGWLGMGRRPWYLVASWIGIFVAAVLDVRGVVGPLFRRR